ncbi:MAG: plasmid pRiA4b ORF-3 family protein [Desulfosarcina sp.]|nr:plasmid pRiA4b ORF-3 family protein [Desulfosarcina sp.]MBC2742347.1 plasmid pRiA4b ORF-3 family protein [Desulfosarcina sp.]MBC2765258.1 plasmid pRiA4b ORF-3 family protein [Desulfosarcina sp.]
MNDRLYLLKIRLLDIEPEIWRRFVVPGSITLDRLHDVIQIVMGWEDYHLYSFTIGKKRYTENPESREDGADDGRFRLVDLIKQKGRTFDYRYDFGDCWEHEITIEDNRYFNPELQTTVACIEGERACPPEDVGGVPGYYKYYRGLIDPEHEEHNSYKTWYGGSAWNGVFEGEAYDIEKTNCELMKYLRWSRARFKSWEPRR